LKAVGEERGPVVPVDGKDGDERGQGEQVGPKREQGMVAMTCIARIAKPLFKMIDRPWKVSLFSSVLSLTEMYPD
jgi:hypothetical protein